MAADVEQKEVSRRASSRTPGAGQQAGVEQDAGSRSAVEQDAGSRSAGGRRTGHREQVVGRTWRPSNVPATRPAAWSRSSGAVVEIEEAGAVPGWRGRWTGAGRGRPASARGFAAGGMVEAGGRRRSGPGLNGGSTPAAPPWSYGPDSSRVGIGSGRGRAGSCAWCLGLRGWVVDCSRGMGLVVDSSRGMNGEKKYSTNK